MKIISLGWGVQSFGLAMMSALGVLPKVDVALHADTGHERAETYALAEKWTPWLEKHGVPVVTVRASAKTRDLCGSGRTPPLFTLSIKTGKRGQLYQTCTDRWKIQPMLKWLRPQLEKGQSADKLIGITLDEVARMKRSRNKIEVLHYPFIDAFDHPWRRGDVLRWLYDNELEIPVKSGCYFCPWHSQKTWRDIQLSGNGDWEKALEVDRAIRNKRQQQGYLCFLTVQRKPLEECDFRSQQEHGQLTLWEEEECSGMCFL